MGAAAVERLASNEHGILVGVTGNDLTVTPLDEVVGRKKPLDTRLLELAQVQPRCWPGSRYKLKKLYYCRPRGASVHACEPAVLPASVPPAFCPAASRFENRLTNLEVRPTEQTRSPRRETLWLRFRRAVKNRLTNRMDRQE